MARHVQTAAELANTDHFTAEPLWLLGGPITFVLNSRDSAEALAREGAAPLHIAPSKRAI